MGIVVGLEVIGIDHHQRERAVVPRGALPFAAERAVEMPAVGEIREAVGGGENREFRLGFLAPGQLVHQINR